MVVLGRTSVWITHTLGMPGEAHGNASIHFGFGKSGQPTRLNLVPNKLRRDGLTTGILAREDIPEKRTIVRPIGHDLTLVLISRLAADLNKSWEWLTGVGGSAAHHGKEELLEGVRATGKGTHTSLPPQLPLDEAWVDGAVPPDTWVTSPEPSIFDSSLPTPVWQNKSQLSALRRVGESFGSQSTW